MAVQTPVKVNPAELKREAQAELSWIRTHCHKFAIDDNIRRMRKLLGEADLSLSDIGTSENELQRCSGIGHKNTAHKASVSKDMETMIERMLGK